MSEAMEFFILFLSITAGFVWFFVGVEFEQPTIVRKLEIAIESIVAAIAAYALIAQSLYMVVAR